MNGRPAAELQGLLEFFAVHRRAADRGESVGRAVEVDVTRTIPADVQATPNIQYVYYRTVSKTAYGSTVDIDIAKDKHDCFAMNSDGEI